MLYQIIFCVGNCIQEPLLISKKFIVLLHTLSAYNSLLVRYKVYLYDPRECLCTSWRYAEVYENFSIDPAPCRKNPKKKKKNSILNCQPRLLGENCVTAKVSLEILIKNVLKENKLWNRTFKSAFKWLELILK